jgi:anti-sigma B factor antagonist
MDVLPPPFECSSTNGDLRATWIRATGELDIATTPQLRRRLRGSEAQVVVLDLTELAFVDSSGVHAIVDASARARQAGRRLILLRGSGPVQRMLALTLGASEVDVGECVAHPEASTGSLQRSLVASSLLRSGEAFRGRQNGR